MANPHCSKCCPVKPPAPRPPWVPEWGVYLWLTVIGGTVVGGWWSIVWAGSRLWH